MKEEDRRKSHPNFPTMMKTIDPQIQEVQLSPSRKKNDSRRRKQPFCFKMPVLTTSHVLSRAWVI